MGFLIRLYNIQEPFIGLHDWASADVSRPPQAWLKYGLLNTKLAPVWNYGIVLDSYEYYLHWPSLTYVFILLSYLVFGIHDWAARLVPVFFNTLTIIFVYLIGKEIWNRTAGLWGAFIFCIIPVNAYYGRIVVFEPVAIFFVSAALYFYIKWLSEPDRGRVYIFLLFLMVLLGTSVHWQVYITAILIFLHGLYLLFTRRLNSKKMAGLFALPAAALTSALAFFLQYRTAQGNWGFDHLYEVVMDRSTSGADVIFTTLQYGVLILKRSTDIFGYMVLFLALVGIVAVIINRGDRFRFSLFVLLLINGFSWLILFKKFSYIHEFTLIGLGAFVSLSAGAGVYYLCQILNREHIKKFGSKAAITSGTAKANIILPVTLVLITVAIIGQSYFSLTKRHQWHGYESLYHVGIFMHENTEQDCVILAAFQDPGPPTIDYYSDRCIVYGIKNLEETRTWSGRNDVNNLYLAEVTDLLPVMEEPTIKAMKLGQHYLFIRKIK